MRKVFPIKELGSGLPTRANGQDHAGENTSLWGRCERIDSRVRLVMKVYYYHGSQIIVLPFVLGADSLCVGRNLK